MSGEIFNDGSMLEIFRAEVETHAETLTSGLLSLERDPQDTQQISEMMRGAHSIKGAARIVGIDPAVRVAHVMEDGFVAAQNGQLSLRPEQIDVLLRGVDFLSRISAASKEASLDWSRFDGDAAQLVSSISHALSMASETSRPVAMASNAGSVPVVSTVTPPTVPRPVTDTVTVSVAPFLDTAEAEVVRRGYVDACNSSAQRFILDLSQTVDLDATGLALLAALRDTRGGQGPHVEFTGVGPDVQFVLRVTGIQPSPDSGGP
ncbi:Hpt domain-containing protein [Schlesneria paludicola]|uniref:Hpt domain-containing protein n=1 Tax=Schlesneria paludicola TaxID=360056 RepID=UPI00029A3A80|nr:Hpt domain-containing protein [Schlesneria paludicola]